MTPDNYTYLRQFLAKLEVEDCAWPEIVLEDDGELGFDWPNSKDCQVSVSLNESGRVGFAFLIHGTSGHGHFQLPEWPSMWSDGLKLLRDIRNEEWRQAAKAQEQEPRL